MNEEIRVREVQLIDQTGHNLGPVEIQIALDKAQEAGLDLVEIAPIHLRPSARFSITANTNIRRRRRPRKPARSRR